MDSLEVVHNLLNLLTCCDQLLLQQLNFCFILFTWLCLHLAYQLVSFLGAFLLSFLLSFFNILFGCQLGFYLTLQAGSLHVFRFGLLIDVSSNVFFLWVSISLELGFHKIFLNLIKFMLVQSIQRNGRVVVLLWQLLSYMSFLGLGASLILFELNQRCFSFFMLLH